MQTEDFVAPETKLLSEEDRAREAGTFPAVTVFGVPVRVHGIFSMLIFVFGIIGAVTANTELALFIPAVLAASAIHELGHTLTAKRLGYPVRSIILHPFRGLSSFLAPQNPRHEFWIAVAGPATNLLTAALIGGACLALGKHPAGLWSGDSLVHFLQGNLLGRFVFFNAFIALLNLIPAFPMDGGQALRGILGVLGIPRATAMRAVVMVSYVTAVLCVAAGILLANTWWILFAALITMGTTHRVGNETFLSAVSHLTVREVMESEVRTLLLAQTLSSAANSGLPACQRFFPVTAGGGILGTVSRNSIERGVRSGKGGAYIAEFMDRTMIFADPEEPLQAVLERSRLSSATPILVGEQENFLGMVTLESIQRRLSHALPVRVSSVDTDTSRRA